MSKKEVKYIVVRDGFWWGIIGDLFMYGIWISILWFNKNYLGNNWLITLVLTLLLFSATIKYFSDKFRKEFNSKEDAIKYLEEL